MKLWAAMLTLGALGACSVSADYGSTHYHCGDGKCPTGYQCLAGVCEASAPADAGAGADGAPAGDGAPAADGAPSDGPPSDGRVIDAAPASDGSVTPDAAVPPGPCGGVSLLRDDFNDGVRSDDWDSFFDSPGVLAETGGQLVLTLGNAVPGSVYLGYTSHRRYDLRGDRASVEVPVVPSPAGHGQGMLVLTDTAGNSVQMLYENGSLYFQRRIAGSYTDLGQLPYDPVAHRFWAIEEDAGTVHWQTSPDGVTWTTRSSAPDPILVKLVEVDLIAGTYQSETAPGSVHFDNLDTGAPAAHFCKASTLTDDFTDGIQGDVWARSYAQGGATRAETSGQLVLTPVATGFSQAAYVSSTAYDLTASSVSVEVPQMLSTTSQAYAELELSQLTPGHYVEFFQRGGMLEVVQATGAGATTKTTLTYSPTEHRFWRIREAAGMLFFETSSNGMTFVTRFSEADPLPLTGLDVYLIATTDAAVAAPGSLHYDNFNLLP